MGSIKYHMIISMIKRTAGAILLFSLCFEANADIYRIVDEKGSVTFTNIPLKKIPKGTEYTLVFKSLIRARKQSRDPIRLASIGRNRTTFESIIVSAGQRHNVDPKLLHAVIRAESGYNPRAVSHKGAVGLMQLMPQTADRYGVTDPEDPHQNINGGANYLSDLMDLFASDLRLAVAAYNAGEQNVIKYGNTIPPFRETQQYVAKVLGFYLK